MSKLLQFLNTNSLIHSVMCGEFVENQLDEIRAHQQLIQKIVDNLSMKLQDKLVTFPSGQSNYPRNLVEGIVFWTVTEWEEFVNALQVKIDQEYILRISPS